MQTERKQFKLLFAFINTAIICVVGYLLFKYVLPSLLPFLCAFILVSVTKPLNDYLVRKLSASKKTVGAMITVVLVSLLSVIIYFSVSRLLREIAAFASFLADGGITDILQPLSEKTYIFLDRFLPENSAKSLALKSFSSSCIIYEY